MKRLAVTALAAVLLLGAGACADDGNDPQAPNTGDTLERPTSSGPSSTDPP